MIDFYSKAVLTVIAISLLLITVNPWISETRLRVNAPGIEHSIGNISSAISFLERLGNGLGDPGRRTNNQS